MQTLTTHVYVAVGGTFGALLRHVVGQWATTWVPGEFPWGTLLINVSGSLLLGFLLRTLPRSRLGDPTRALLTVGVCGGFTTFSAFAYETFALLGEGRPILAWLYVGGTVVLGPIAALGGDWLGSRLGR